MLRASEVIEELTTIHALTQEEAERILSSFLRKRRHDLYLERHEIREADYLRILDLVKLVKRNVPIQYILKETQFLHWNLHVEEGVFIPRPETEGLVVVVKETCQKPPGIIFDIGTGSGCIAIALAHFFPESTVYALDISSHALKVADINIKKYHLQDRIILKKGDLFSRLDQNIKPDLIVSNPPYVPAQGMKALPDSVKYFEHGLL